MLAILLCPEVLLQCTAVHSSKMATPFGLATVTYTTWNLLYPHVDDTITQTPYFATTTTVTVPIEQSGSAQVITLSYTDTSVSWADGDQKPIDETVAAEWTTAVPKPSPVTTLPQVSSESNSTVANPSPGPQPSVFTTSTTASSATVASTSRPAAGQGSAFSASHRSLSGGAIAAIVVGALAGLFLMVGIIVFVLRTRRQIRRLNERVSVAPSGSYEKPELPAQELSSWRRVFGYKAVELSARNETKARPELEGSQIEPAEVDAHGAER